MLKIKDDVDLKELEKFGFEYNYEFGVGMYIKSMWYEEEVDDLIYGKSIQDFCNRISLFEKDRKIRDNHSSQVKMDYDTLFDLIQAGLVEKVGE